MIQTLNRLLGESPLSALAFVFWAGAMVTLSSCIVLRLPVVFGYVAGTTNGKKQGLMLTASLALGLVIGSIVLASMVAFSQQGLATVFALNKYFHWGLGLTLFVAGLLASGLIGPRLLPEKCRQPGAKLRMVIPLTALLLGVALGLLVIPACPNCGAGLILLAKKVAVARLGLFGLALFLGFALGQAVPILAVGALTSLGRPELVARMRSRLCSIEQRIGLLAGNTLMAVGVYFLVVG